MKAKCYQIFVRIVARLLDGIIATFLAFGVMYVLQIPLDTVSEVFYPVVFLAGWLLLEALLMASWGTTPAKYFLGITVMREGGERLGLKHAILRSLLLYTEGNVFALPYAIVVAWVANLIVFLVTGKTLYDRHGSFIVNTDHVRKVRLVVVIILVVAIGIIGLLSGSDGNTRVYYTNIING
jgi:uncharacterized RDD family membrane protein YckC